MARISLGLLLVAALALLLVHHTVRANKRNPPDGTFFALAGRDCVVLASDSRFSDPYRQGLLQDYLPRDVYRVGDKTLVGFYGMAFHAQVLMNLVRSKLADYRNADLDPAHIARLVANALYRHEELSVNPLVAGIDERGEPYLCSMDSLGAQTTSRSFAVVGTAQEELLSLCESLYRAGLKDSELVGLASRCSQLAFQRNILSGGNVKILTLRRDGTLFSKEIEFRDV